MKEFFKRRVQKSIKNADPATFSRRLGDKEISDVRQMNEKIADRGLEDFDIKTLLLRPAFNKKGRSVLYDKDGGRFHEIYAEAPMQQVISRILKPFFNIADVVEFDGHFFSYEPIVRNMQKTSKEETEADIKMIDILVRDSDRSFRTHNVKRKRRRSLFYDFGGARGFFFMDFLTKKDVNLFSKSISGCSRQTQNYFTEKARRMKQYWESKEGRQQVEAAFRVAGQSIESMFPREGAPASFDDFYRTLLDRVELLNKVADELKQ